MKTRLKLICGLVLLGLLTFNVKAVIILQDNFDGYATGDLTNNSAGFWSGHSGAAPILVTNFPTLANPNNKVLQVSQGLAQDVHALFTGGASFGTSGTDVLYASFTLTVTNLPGATTTYFAHFYQDSSTFRGKLFIMTNGITPGAYHIGILNGGNPTQTTPSYPQDLLPGVSYSVILSYTPSTGISKLWVNPVDASSTSVTASDSASTGTIVGYAFRQASPEGVLYIDNLLVGTNFSDVVSSGPVAPTIVIQPQDTNVFVGSDVTFTTSATGDAPISYQWYYNTNTTLNGATNATLTISNVTTLSAGTYSAIASNNVSTATTRYALLTVSSVPIPPTITNQPASTTVNAGDTATFTVVAGGSPTLAYQWSSVIGGFTNSITNATAATLTLSGVTTSKAGQYFVTITNSFGSTNSALATLTVNPPVALSIGQLRSMVDTNYAPTNTTTAFTITGIVTTWTNMTTSTTSSEFYMQDASGGIAVFWSGAAPSTNLPPAGSLVQVTGPLAAFSGLLEIEPVLSNPLHNVTIISTNNPLPKPLPLPFDPNVTNLAAMKQFEGMYFVASNVMLNLTTPNFTASANDYITNNTHKVLSASTTAGTINFTNDQGQTFILFVNSATDLPNKPKPTTPVTVFGILGYFSSAGFEFTPSRYADVISYNHVTNILQNLTRQGDLPTNNFTESVLRPGESLTTDLGVGDPEGGSMTLTPITDGLPASAYWTNVVNGLNAHATFKFNPTSADAGVNYTIALGASSTSGSVFTNYFYVYVPSAVEQQIYISEFLASPTANTNLAYFNPLHRNADTNAQTVRDQYVEIANLSSSPVDLYGWSLGDASQYNHAFINGAPQEQLGANNAIIIYGGVTPVANDLNPPVLPVLSYPVKNGATGGGTNLALVKSGTGVIVLRNPSYYNDGHGIQPGYIVDRVVYDNAAWPTNAGSLTRFPTLTNGFVPQGYVSTNYATAGLQYDGSSWSAPAKIPVGVNNIAITSSNSLVLLKYTANTSQASTLWSAHDVTGPYSVLYGFQPTNSAASFSVTNSSVLSKQFFYITTQ